MPPLATCFSGTRCGKSRRPTPFARVHPFPVFLRPGTCLKPLEPSNLFCAQGTPRRSAMNTTTESANAQARELIRAISEVDLESLRTRCHADVAIQVTGARDVDLTIHSDGVDVLRQWVKDVRRLCGLTTFSIHRYVENGCELMTSGAIHIERLPRTFSSPCSLLLRFEAGQVIFLQLLLDTYALEKFRGQMD